MKTITLLTFIFGSFFLQAQTSLIFDLKKTTAHNCTTRFHGEDIQLINTSDKAALLWLNNISFKNGIIDVDLKGKDVRGESFLGIAFHGLNDSTYSAVYFRPFNFRSEERKNHSVQYVDLPGYDWDMLREKHPGKFENAVKPVPDPSEWFHAKIIVNFPEIKVYVNGSQQPSLVVAQISSRKDGKLGLWIDSKDGWFKNLKLVQH